MFFEIRHWEILDSFNIPPRIYFYEGALARLAYYNFTSKEPSRIPICKGNIVIVQLRLGRPSASPFKIYYMAYSARPGSLEYDMATQFKGKPFSYHDDVIKWKHFPGHWPFVRGIHRLPVISPHKGQWRGALIFSLIYTLNKRLSKQSWS